MNELVVGERARAVSEKQIRRVAEMVVAKTDLSVTGNRPCVKIGLGRFDEAEVFELDERHLKQGPKLTHEERYQDIEEAVRVFFDLAYDDDRTFPFSQRYAVFCYASKDKLLGKIPFSVSLGKQGGGGEPPTMLGERAQEMRQREGMFRVSIGGSQQLIDRLMEENDRLRDRCEKLEKKQDEMLHAREDLLDRKAERDLNLEEKREWRVMRKKLFEQFERRMLPGLIERFSPHGPVKHFLMGLSQEQKAGFIGSLSEEQMQAFISLMSLLQNGAPGEAETPADVLGMLTGKT